MNLRFLMLSILFLLGVSSASAFDFDDIFRELNLNVEKAIRDAGKNVNKATLDASKAIEKASGELKSIDNSATRIFAGPKQYPPAEYAAYAIFAFPALPSDSDMERYLMFCEAYISVVPHASEVDVPKSQQLVTVWPIKSDNIADHVNRIDRSSTCTFAVLHYGYRSSKEAIDDAEVSGLNMSDRKGPFLIAWAPPSDRGVPNNPVLYMDLSTVVSLAEAKRRMAMWVSQIEEEPELWKNGWAVAKIKILITNWANDLGEKALNLFTG